MRDGTRNVTVPIAQAVIRSLAVNAVKGNHRAQRLFSELLETTERANKRLHDEWLETAISYKVEWEQDLERRQSHGIVATDPIPHPDDIEIDMNTGQVLIKGPMTGEEKAKRDLLRQRKTELEAELAENRKLLRVRPETLWRITEFSEHESNGRELDEGERVAVEVLPVLGQSAAAVEPGDGAFDHPTPGLDDEALHPIGSLDDLGLEIGQDAGQGAVKDRALIGAVGEQFPEKGKQTEQGRQQRETAVAILNGGGGADAVQQQALRIDQNMPLLALDQLAGIEAVAVDASPPFSALFTL